MPTTNEPFDLNKTIDACAEHAWKTREAELKRRGIESEAQLRKEIDQTVHDPKTKAFHAHYEQKPGDKPPEQAFRREVYDKRPHNEANPNHGMTVILNPTPDPQTGKPHGGTCYIRERDQLEPLRRQEQSAVGTMPEVAIGGRAALQQQDKHRQVMVVEQKQPEKVEPIPTPKREAEKPSPTQDQKTPNKTQETKKPEPDKLQFKRDTPKEQEKPAQQNQANAPEKQLQFKRDTPREQEKGPSPDKAKSEQKAQQSEQLAFKRDDPTKTQGNGR